MLDELAKIREDALKRLENIKSEEELSELNTSVLGRNGALTAILRTMGKLSAERRAQLGKAANEVKQSIAEALEARKAMLDAFAEQKRIEDETVDVTLPGIIELPSGKLNPLTKVYREIRDALVGLGFTTFEGPEIEYDDFNFTKLNLPPDHPARDMQDTFFIKNTHKSDFVLRTHTSGVQIRTMQKQKPPIRIMAPGRVFRKDSLDATHSPVFHQIEGLYVDKNVSLADLKRDLTVFMQGLFGKKAEVRFRPSFFPFTEPSVEVDVKCVFCEGKDKNCPVCKGSGWKEMMGAGIVHPNVLRNCQIDPEVYSGYAFGMGVERLAMFSLGIKDIRTFYENDIRILEQF